MKKILIIGAGASGMAAAIAARERGAHVEILEKKEQAGKKLAITGNGRCNFSNVSLTPACYHTHAEPADAAMIGTTLDSFGTQEAVSFFRGLGLLETERNGGLYPVTQQAATVVNALTRRLKTLEIPVLTGQNVTKIRRENGGFIVCSEDAQKKETRHRADAVILCCGSEAGVRDPHAFSAYKILREMGHHVYPAVPVLVPLYGKCGVEEQWNGVRLSGSIRFGESFSIGELQLTKDGVSGIPAFQVSRDIAEHLKKEKTAEITLDLLPEYDEAFLLSLLEDESEMCAEETGEVLRGWLPKKLVPVVLKRAKIYGNTSVGELSESDRMRLIGSIKRFEYTVTGTGTMETAQAVSGGLSLSEITETMESKRVPGLYITGELLDVDGICGGYNLHFAWATGLTAGTAAAGERN